jgi:hypothetical protein
MPAATSDATLARMQAFIRFQYRANRAVTLAQIRDRRTGPYRIHPHLAHFIYGSERRCALVLATSAAGACCASSTWACAAHQSSRDNQFIALAAEELARVELLYDVYLDDVAAIVGPPAHPGGDRRRLRAAIRNHLHALRDFVARTRRGPPQWAGQPARYDL